MWFLFHFSYRVKHVCYKKKNKTKQKHIEDTSIWKKLVSSIIIDFITMLETVFFFFFSYNIHYALPYNLNHLNFISWSPMWSEASRLFKTKPLFRNLVLDLFTCHVRQLKSENAQIVYQVYVLEILWCSFTSKQSKKYKMLFFLTDTSTVFIKTLLFDDLLILFRIVWCTSAGKERTSWLFPCAVLLYVVLIFCVPFPYGVWGRKWNCIGSWSLHFHLLCISKLLCLCRVVTLSLPVQSLNARIMPVLRDCIYNHFLCIDEWSPTCGPNNF